MKKKVQLAKYHQVKHTTWRVLPGRCRSGTCCLISETRQALLRILWRVSAGQGLTRGRSGNLTLAVAPHPIQVMIRSRGRHTDHVNTEQRCLEGPLITALHPSMLLLQRSRDSCLKSLHTINFYYVLST